MERRGIQKRAVVSRSGRTRGAGAQRVWVVSWGNPSSCVLPAGNLQQRRGGPRRQGVVGCLQSKTSSPTSTLRQYVTLVIVERTDLSSINTRATLRLLQIHSSFNFHPYVMPVTTAAAKALRQNLKARARNSAVKTRLKKLSVQLRKAYTAKNMDQAKTLTLQLVKGWDKAAQQKVVTRNTTARKKSRLMRRWSTSQA